MNWIILGVAIFLNALANILIKIGVIGKSRQLSIDMFNELITTPAILGGVLSFILALVAYGYVLSRMNLSIAYPLMTSIGFVIITLASRFILKEPINPIQIAGFLFILLGVWMVAK
jgi:multidrug transporter EmrE-like cation transporter